MATGDKIYIGVKSVQRLVIPATTKENITTSINTVNPDKCIVLINNEVLSMGGAADSISSFYTAKVYGSTLVNLTENSITITANYSETNFTEWDKIGTISVQIIEFY